MDRCSGYTWNGDGYGVLRAVEDDIRLYIKKTYGSLKEKQIKDLLNRKTWMFQKRIMERARQLQQHIGTDRYDDFNGYDAAVKATGVKLDAKEKKQITAAVSWKNPEAEKVIKKVHKKSTAKPVYGLFTVDGKVVEYQADGDLRDHENIALDPTAPCT